MSTRSNPKCFNFDPAAFWHTKKSAERGSSALGSHHTLSGLKWSSGLLADLFLPHSFFQINKHFLFFYFLKKSGAYAVVSLHPTWLFMRGKDTEMHGGKAMRWQRRLFLERVSLSPGTQRLTNMREAQRHSVSSLEPSEHGPAYTLTWHFQPPGTIKGHGRSSSSKEIRVALMVPGGFWKQSHKPGPSSVLHLSNCTHF